MNRLKKSGKLTTNYHRKLNAFLIPLVRAANLLSKAYGTGSLVVGAYTCNAYAFGTCERVYRHVYSIENTYYSHGSDLLVCM